MNIQFHFILILLLIPFQDTSSGLNSIVSSGLNGAQTWRRGPCHGITDSQLALLGPGGIAKKSVLLWFSRPSGELCERMLHQLLWFYGTAVLSLEALWCEQQTLC